MQGLRLYTNDIVRLELSSSSTNSSSSSSSSSSTLSIDGDESAETRIRRLISEHPVLILSRSSCCMCHAMKKLLVSIGAHPTVIELDDNEIAALPNAVSPPFDNRVPAVFIGGTCVGGLDSLFTLHVSNLLVPKLLQVGALC